MQVKWKSLITRLCFWLIAEIILNFLGNDDMADYSEFIFERDLNNLYQKNNHTVMVSKFSPIFCIKVNEFCPITRIENPIEQETENNSCPFPLITNKCKKLDQPCPKTWFVPNC